MKCSICGSKDERTISKTTDKYGSKYYCIECRVTHSCLGKFNFKNNSKFIDDITGEKGAVKFEWLNETYVLEKERMVRLLSHELKSEEYFSLAKNMVQICL